MIKLKNFLPKKSNFPKVDYWEVRLEVERNTIISVKNGDVDEITEGERTRGSARVLQKGGWGFSSFNKLEDTSRHINSAVDFATSVGGGDAKVVELPPVEMKLTTDYDKHPDDVSLDEKLSVVKDYEAVLREHPGSTLSNVDYGDRVRTSLFLNSEGSLIERDEIFTRGVMRLSGKVDGLPEMSMRGFRHRSGFEGMLFLDELREELFKEFDDLLIAENAKGGVYNCILDPHIAGVFAHEAFGHTSEADGIYKDPQMAEVMKLGRKLGSDAITIIDDGSINPLSGGYLPYDDEGIEGGRTTLLDKGILTAHLHSRETARRMGEEATGNARLVNVGFSPIVRMTNTFIETGDASYGDLLKELGDGLLVVGSRGGSGGEDFTFAARIGYLIEKGEITKPVKNFTLTGNLFETLKNIKRCSDEIELKSTAGGCGKGEQFPLPVGLGGPYVLLSNALIGGR